MQFSFCIGEAIQALRRDALCCERSFKRPSDTQGQAVSTGRRPHRAGDAVDDLCRACKAVLPAPVVAPRARAGSCSSCAIIAEASTIIVLSTARLRPWSTHGRWAPMWGSGRREKAAWPPRLQPQTTVRRFHSWPSAKGDTRRCSTIRRDRKPLDIETVLRRVSAGGLGLTPVVAADKWGAERSCSNLADRAFSRSPGPSRPSSTRSSCFAIACGCSGSSINGADVPERT